MPCVRNFIIIKNHFYVKLIAESDKIKVIETEKNEKRIFRKLLKMINFFKP